MVCELTARVLMACCRLLEGHTCGCQDHDVPGCHVWQGEAGEDGHHGDSHQRQPEPPQHRPGVYATLAAELEWVKS